MIPQITLTPNNHLPLPLPSSRPFHVHLTIPLSLALPNFNPTTTSRPKFGAPRPWWIPKLFQPRPGAQEQAAAASVQARVQARAHLNTLWEQLSPLVFGSQEKILHAVMICDERAWEGVAWEGFAESNLFWSFSTAGVVDDTEGLDEARVVVLKVSPAPTGAGGIEVSVGEMGAGDREDWKEAWTRIWNRHPDASDDELDQMDWALVRNMTLNEVLSGRFESFEGDDGKRSLEGPVRSLGLWNAPRFHVLRLLCCCWD